MRANSNPCSRTTDTCADVLSGIVESVRSRDWKSNCPAAFTVTVLLALNPHWRDWSVHAVAEPVSAACFILALHHLLRREKARGSESDPRLDSRHLELAGFEGNKHVARNHESVEANSLDLDYVAGDSLGWFYSLGPPTGVGGRGCPLEAVDAARCGVEDNCHSNRLTKYHLSFVYQLSENDQN